MERSNISARSGGWKQSVVKDNTGDSRIGRDKRDQLPVKFSPAKYAELTGNTTKALVRSKILSYSQDEIVVGNERERSESKDRYPAKRLTTVQTPRSNNNDGNAQLKLALKKDQSEKSLQRLVFSPLKKGGERNARDATQFMQEIKLQYMRFKDKILGQLKKLQEDIRVAIQQVMAAVSKANNQNLPQNNLKVIRHGSHENRTPSFGLLSDQPLRIVNQLPKAQIPQIPSIDPSKYRDLTSSQNTLQSVLPKIRQKMSKFFDIMGQLKSEINDQAMYSPINAKHAKEDEVQPQMQII